VAEEWPAEALLFETNRASGGGFKNRRVVALPPERGSASCRTSRA